MFTIRIDKVEVHLHADPETTSKLEHVMQILTRQTAILQEIKLTEQEFLAVLQKIDSATSATAATVQVIATTTGTIGTEMDTLEAQLAAALATGTPVTQAMVDAASATSDKAQALSDAANALVPVLQGIASKGAGNPVPVPVPPTPSVP